MINLKLLRHDPDQFKSLLARRGVQADLLDQIIRLDEQTREQKSQLDQLRAEQKALGSAQREQASALKQQIQSLSTVYDQAVLELQALSSQLPNLPSEDTPDGRDESDNQVIRQIGSRPQFQFAPLDHLALAEGLGLISTERAAKTSGSRFAYLFGGLVQIQFALVQWVMQTLTDTETLSEIAKRAGLSVPIKPFIPVVPPVFIKPDIYQKMARLEPRDERYYLPADDLYLIGSAEHTLGPLFLNEIIPTEQLPLRLIGYSTSFRREAGTYGKDTRGILRQHQFDKLEMEVFSTPADSLAEQNFLVAIQEYFLDQLGLPYQVIQVCIGDMGDPDARQIDIETFMPGQDRYRETHTADLMTDYQARRLNTRFKSETGQTELVHTNDATALAIGRILIAIMENYQQADGTIKIPSVLQPWLNFDRLDRQTAGGLPLNQ